MARRNPPQSKTDENSFPVRIKLETPPFGFGNVLNEMIAWLQDNLPRGDFAQHSGSQMEIRRRVRDSWAVYFRTVHDAQRFLDAFPGVKLADWTSGASYTSPVLPFGRKEG